MANDTVSPPMTRTAAIATDLVVGVVAGLAASFAMNQFQSLWAKAVPMPEGPTAAEEAADAVSEEVSGAPVRGSQKGTADSVVHYATGALIGAVYGLAAGVFPAITLGGGLLFTDALRLLIAHAVAASGNWRVLPDARRPDSKAVEESVAASLAQTAFAAEAKAVRALLGPALKDMEDADGVAGHAHQDDEVTFAVFTRLLKLKDHEVARIGAFVMAETLASGGAVTDAFGAHAKVSARDHWTPDATFFDLLRDRTTVGAMLAEVAGQKAADRLVSAKLKDQKAALATAAAGKEEWCPGWMRFPTAEL